MIPNQILAEGITYFPKSRVIKRGAEEYPEHSNTFGGMYASAKLEPATITRVPGADDTITPGRWNTTNLTKPMRAAVEAANWIKQKTGGLYAADDSIPQVADRLAPLILVRLHQQIMGQMQTWFHLDSAYNHIQVDKLLYRMPFQDNPAAVQRVGIREQYDVNKVEYFESTFDLRKIVASYDVAWEDALRATIDFEPTLQANMDYSQKFVREQDAATGIMQMGHPTAARRGRNPANARWWDIETNSFKTFSATDAPVGNGANDVINADGVWKDADKVLKPGQISGTDGDGFHSAERTVDKIQFAIHEFVRQNDMHISACVCSPRVGMRLASNTFTGPNMINNVEAYRTTTGGTRSLPGLPEVTMVMSLFMDDHTIYLYNKEDNPLTLAQGPSQTKQIDDPTRFRKIMATAQFYQYKYTPEDFRDKLERFWGFAIPITPSEDGSLVTKNAF